MGTYALSAGYADAWYKQASRVRTLIRQEMAEVFAGVDVIAGPVAPEAAFLLGSKTDDPLKMYLVDLFTDVAAVAGLPAMSVPAGFVSAANAPRSSKSEVGLPVGLQLIAPHFREDLLFQVGHAYEQAHEWWKQTPGL
jgi:aspartyl-tRNA(Asn)/glutamyl-tRNA(Gln) amidotransferase subunit A